MRRRDFVKVLSCGAASLGALRALGPLRHALAGGDSSEFFLTIYVNGGWDVLSWAAPLTTPSDAVDPVSTDNTLYTDTTRYPAAKMRLWTDGATVNGGKTFVPVQAKGVTLGPAIGDMIDHFDGVTLFNGIATSTVAHPDGTAFCLSGQHLSGGSFGASTLDAIVASELGTDRPIPAVALTFPARVVGTQLDPRAAPVTVGGIASVATALSRHEAFTTQVDQKAVDALLLDETTDLKAEVAIPGAASAYAAQLKALTGLKIWGSSTSNAFDANYLQNKYMYDASMAAPSGIQRIDSSYFTSYFIGPDAAFNLAFAAEAFATNLCRCVSIGVGAYDDHAATGYQLHAMKIERMMNGVAALLAIAKATPHPTIASDKVFDHLHVMMVSEFCRSPRLNANKGRDHHPNNAAVVVSPRFKGGTIVGGFDDQLEPKAPTMITTPTGTRAMSQADLVTTMIDALGLPTTLRPRDGFTIPGVLV